MGMDHAYSRIELSEVGVIIPEPITFEEAVKLFKMRVPMTKQEWQELEAKLRFRAFTVARLTELDAVEAVRKRVIKAIEEGKTLGQFWEEAGRDELLRRAGFHRGDPWYWETVFRTNIQTAYNAGRAYEFKKNPPAYLEFVGIMDTRQTPICRARSGVIRRADDPFWSTNWPPLHHNCRSTVRAIHKDEYEALGLKETETLPKDLPKKGFGLNPLESGSFWKMTDSMAERAKRYGIMDEIEATAKELGLNIKEIKIKPKKTDTLSLDKYEYNTISDVENFVRDFSKAYPEMFRAGFGGMKEVNKEYFMATNPANGVIYVSARAFNKFVPARDLISAFHKLKHKGTLTFEEEYALECLWHEINHNKVKKYVWLGGNDTKQGRVMEAVNQLVSRYTYDRFLKLIGANAALKKEIIKQGLGYQNYIENMREIFKAFRVSEKKFVRESEKILLDDYGLLYDGVVDILVRLGGRSWELVDKLLAHIDLPKEKFKEKLMKIMKGHGDSI